MKLYIENTQNKIYNDVQRTHLDGNDLEEGELICKKCEGSGSWPKKFATLEDPSFARCPKCQGAGIVDWIENIVGKPIMTGTASSSSHSLSSGMAGTSGISYKPVKNIPIPQNICMKSVTNYKRRIGV